MTNCSMINFNSYGCKNAGFTQFRNNGSATNDVNKNSNIVQSDITSKPANPEKPQKPLLNPKNTGYIATGALLLTCIRPKITKKFHKHLGWLTVLLSAAHIGVVEYFHHKVKRSN